MFNEKDIMNYNLYKINSNFGGSGRSEMLEEIVQAPSCYTRIVAYFNSFSKKVVCKGFITLVDQGIFSITKFLTGVIIARSCTKEQLGIYTLGFSIVLFATQFQQSFVSSPYTAFCPNLIGNKRALYAGSTLIHQFLFSLIAVIGLISLGIMFSFGVGPVALVPVIWALVITIALILLREYVRRISFANLQFTIALVLDLFVALVQIGGLLLLSYLDLLSASRAYLVIGIACGISAIFWFIWMHKDFIFRLSEMIIDLKRNLSFGKWVCGSAILVLLGTQLYHWFLTVFHGAEATAALSVCFGVIGIANSFLWGFSNLVRPMAAHAYAKGGIKKLRRLVYNTMIFLGIVMTFFCLIVFIFGENLIIAIYGYKYASLASVLLILMLSLFATAITAPFDYGIWAMLRPDANFKVSLISAVMAITVGLWLVKYFYLFGAAFGLLSANIVIFISRYIVFNKLAGDASINADSL